jgi:OmpA-OmpF porin, OOP family
MIILVFALSLHGEIPARPVPLDCSKFDFRDTDHDGVLDKEDACPDQPGRCNRGCPPPSSANGQRIVCVTHDILRFKPQLVFQGSDRISPALAEQLVEIGCALQQNPDIEVVIEGHTRVTNDEKASERLSQRRAEAVREWFVAHGLAAERFSVVGFGSMKPIASNREAKGRMLNDRVELTIKPKMPTPLP